MARQTKCTFKISQLLGGDARDGKVARNFLPIRSRIPLGGVPDLHRIQAVKCPVCLEGPMGRQGHPGVGVRPTCTLANLDAVKS
jgi:hypothetical protein